MQSHYFSYPDTLIIIFAREPVIGQVKTRLIPALGKEGATELYRRLLDHTIEKVISSDLSPVNLSITPESHLKYFEQMSLFDHFKLTIQHGSNLGMRMYNALLAGLSDYSKVVLIGTDCPFLNADDFQQAIIALDDNDMVFSPAEDGGYVLVGAKKVLPGVFNFIDWGTDRVMEQSRLALINHQISWLELSEQCDIDVESDLRKLFLLDEFKELF